MWRMQVVLEIVMQACSANEANNESAKVQYRVARLDALSSSLEMKWNVIMENYNYC